MPHETPNRVTRRDFLQTSLAGAASLTLGRGAGLAAPADRDAVVAHISRQHDATVQMLRDWIALPSIAAENLNYPQGAEYMARLARDAGFDRVTLVPTAGKPGVFATLDAGAATTLGIYFMYDVKQFDASEWSAPFRGVELLHVVHEVDAQRRGGPRVERGEDARLAGRRHERHAVEAGVPGEPGHVFGALGVVEVLGRDRRQGDPVAQHLDRRVVLPGNVGDDRVAVGRGGEARSSTQGQGRGPRQARLKEVAARHAVRCLVRHGHPRTGERKTWQATIDNRRPRGQACVSRRVVPGGGLPATRQGRALGGRPHVAAPETACGPGDVRR